MTGGTAGAASWQQAVSALEARAVVLEEAASHLTRISASLLSHSTSSSTCALASEEAARVLQALEPLGSEPLLSSPPLAPDLGSMGHQTAPVGSLRRLMSADSGGMVWVKVSREVHTRCRPTLQPPSQPLPPPPSPPRATRATSVSAASCPALASIFAEAALGLAQWLSWTALRTRGLGPLCPG